MKAFLQAFYTYSRTERRGIRVLLLIITCLCIIRLGLPYCLPAFTYNEAEVQAKLERLQLAIEAQQHIQDSINLAKQQQRNQWKTKQSSNYDFKPSKNYATRSNKDHTSTFNPHPPKVQKPKKPVRVDLNKADSATLRTVYGIGPTYARRIIAYRELLGGFHQVEQLKEVYGIHDTTYIKLEPQLYLTEVQLKQIDINAADWKILKAHPYISGKVAGCMTKYRKANGRFQSIHDLESLYCLDEVTRNRILPYLIVKVEG